MARRGPKPKPTNLKLIAGSRKDRINKDEPQVPVTIPSPPDWLEGEEVDAFVSHARKLAAMRVMTSADAEALAVAMVSFVHWKEAIDNVRQNGMLVKAKNGTPMHNPYLSIANKAQKDYIDILKEFGMTPSARTRVKV